MNENFSPCEAITSYDPVSDTLAIIRPRNGGFLLTFESSVSVWPFFDSHGSPCKKWIRITEAGAIDQMEQVFFKLASLGHRAA